MKKTIAILRFLLGVSLIIFGLNAFFNFIPQPATPLSEGAAAFATALANTGYMMRLIGATQLIVGLMLALNRYVPLALAMLAPFLVNSFAFHLFLEHTGLPMSAFFVILEIVLAWSYRHAYRPMLARRA